MASFQLKPHLTVEELKERMQKERKVHHFKRWQILHTIVTNKGLRAQQVALLLGTSLHVVRRTVQRYNQKCAAGHLEQNTWGGRREARCHLSFEQEEQLLKSWKATALEGGVLVAKQLREAVETKVGHPISDDYLWDLLHRHGWRKKAPRPEHTKAEEVKEKREALKKNPRTPCKE